MEAVVKALLEEGATADQFLTFANDYDIHDDPFVQEAFNELLANEVSRNRASPQPWSVDDANELLDFLKSPAKELTDSSVGFFSLTFFLFFLTNFILFFLISSYLFIYFRNEIQNVERGAECRKFTCDQCNKTFTQKQVLNRHVRSIDQKLSYHCDKCHKFFSRKANLRQHETSARSF